MCKYSWNAKAKEKNGNNPKVKYGNSQIHVFYLLKYYEVG